MIYQSKMNVFADAERYVDTLPVDNWILISDIPYKIRLRVLELLDMNTRLQSLFDEFHLKFILIKPKGS